MESDSVFTTNVKRNLCMAELSGGYLFPEIAKRRKDFSEKNPEIKILSLGVGNTTEPLSPYIVKAMTEYIQSMGTIKGYSGYGDEQGLTLLRERIASTLYGVPIYSDEVFISDGAKCDIARLQEMFGRDVTIAIQDPAYPVYVDGSIIAGSAKKNSGITYLPCTKENNFFPDLRNIERTDLIYFCSPNNPTGACADKNQLKELVDFARKNKSIIIYDAAYMEFIKDKQYPRSIFEIEGAREVALEVNSFSKTIGFTGVRLGWTIIPRELKFSDGTPVSKDWNRVMTTLFNGASNIAQAGGLAALEKQGLKETRELIDYYMKNAETIRNTLVELNIVHYGGINAPYVWAYFPNQTSWETFTKILTTCGIVTTPGSGFGPCGEHYIRFSSFGHHETINEACERLKKILV